MLFALRPKLNILSPSLVAILLFFFTFVTESLAQKSYPTDYFRPPVDLRLLLSGTFGELRANHFHSGIDIKTNGATGAKVYAIADGYISRINVSAFGFGKALYINHPNGYTSVYAHLDYFTGPVHEYVMDEHYSRESFEMTLYPAAGELPVKKGDLIAYSGNSGSSAGPHLHFEIREEASQEPINPLLFGFEVKDFYRPDITWLKIYAVDENSLVNGQNRHTKFQVEGWGADHRLAAGKKITLSGNIAFGIQCTDRQNDTQNKNGVYQVRVFFDGRLINTTRMEKFSFSETRFINSLIDYEEYMRNSIRLQRTEIDPNNKLSLYEDLPGSGIVFIDDTLEHAVRYEVTDVPGNLSVLEFKITGENSSKSQGGLKTLLPADPGTFYYNGNNRYETEDLKLEAAAGAFYRSFKFTYSKTPAEKNCYAEVHHIHDEYTPVHDYIDLAIKPVGLPDGLKGKALIVKLDDGQPQFSSNGGEYQPDGFVHARIREFGKYSIAVDTVPPVITPLNLSHHKDLSGQSMVKFIIKDELSGIKSYRGTLNGQWILMEYDAKNNLLVYFIEDHLKKGTNSFLLEVTDMKGNRSEYPTSLVR
jgi:hypothetical protein